MPRHRPPAVVHEVPSPHHGFFGVTVAFLGYVLLVVGVAVGLSSLGLGTLAVVVGSGLAAAGLLVGFLPLFRRLTPDRAGET